MEASLVTDKGKKSENRIPHLKYIENIMELWYVVINFIIAGMALNTNNFSRKKVGVLSQSTFLPGIKAPTSNT